ncbi:Extracellular solute-binding protein [Desulfonema limicola]|uniref:Extracellular solute-binding protein n=1 Tax=Desulfonema limicola TaxID=45656 RepID=A0A975BCF7_9BACT|nr:spermidine/putrescine ABC transporter substrate-binding protein [Desulfonema limicola]QTA82793.1 Extracellular solute-binding protein [Desulfonema limicola]
MKKKQIRCWTVLFLLLGFAIIKPLDAAEKQTLVFLNWAEYLNPDLVKEFETEFNAEIKEIFFETDEMRNEKLGLTMGQGYDLVLISGSAISQYIRMQWLARLDLSRIPNIIHISPRWRDAFPGSDAYAVPYTWGTIGIAYRQDIIKTKITSWKQLFEPEESLKGKIMMIKDSNDTIGMALKALGYSINSTSAKELDQAEKLLLSQKPFVKKYSSLILSEKSGLITGSYHMAMAYNGDALTLQTRDKNIEFIVPQEGTNIWIDYLAVMRGSNKKELAYSFINFLNKPENAARSASFLYYATPNKSAEIFLEPEYLKNPVIYPDEAVLSRSEFYKPVPAQAKKKRNSIFSKLLR